MVSWYVWIKQNVYFTAAFAYQVSTKAAVGSVVWLKYLWHGSDEYPVWRKGFGDNIINSNNKIKKKIRGRLD